MDRPPSWTPDFASARFGAASFRADEDAAMPKRIDEQLKQRAVRLVTQHRAGWVEWWNSRRLQGKLGMLTPNEFESARYAARNREVQPT